MVNAGEEEEGLLVLENDEEGNGSEATFPPGIIVLLLLQFKITFSRTQRLPAPGAARGRRF